MEPSEELIRPIKFTTKGAAPLGGISPLSPIFAIAWRKHGFAKAINTLANPCSHFTQTAYCCGMPALITAYDDKGKRVGTCDATCYGARSTNSADCKCICRGANHGAGHRQAVQNVQDLNGEWVEEWPSSIGCIEIRSRRADAPSSRRTACIFMTAQA